jgi:DNA-binding transcriptional LysR family regulator
MHEVRHLLGSLRVFDAVCKAGGVQRAAVQLHVTPGAVSQQIRQLETTLGVALFRKAGREIELVEAGRDLAQRIGDLFDRMEAAVGEFVDQNRPGRIRLRVLPSVATKWLLPRLGSFCAAYPEVEVDLATVTRNEEVQSLADVSFVVRQGHGRWPGLQADLLFEDALLPACSPAVAETIRNRQDLLNATLLYTTMRPDAWSIWFDSAGMRGTTSPRRILLANTALCLQAAADGVGVAMVQQAYVLDDLASGRLVVPIGHVARTGDGYYLVCDPRRRDSYPLLEFREWVRETSITQRARACAMFLTSGPDIPVPVAVDMSAATIRTGSPRHE